MNDQAETLRAPRYSDLPARMRALPLDKRGFPVPWFVARRRLRASIAGKTGQRWPVFPAMDARKRRLAWKDNLCWVCGQKMGRVRAFVIGPMCAVNRTSAEPPCHLDCARWSALNCPFLSRPAMGRVPLDHYGGTGENVPGVMLPRNPGVTLVWQTLRPAIFGAGAGNFLFDIGKPHAVEWYARGRAATRAEVLASIESGLPSLLQLVDADPDPAGARAEYDRRLAAALDLVPTEQGNATDG